MSWENIADELDHIDSFYNWMFRAEVFPHSTRPGGFDFIMCHGNAIGHCPSKDADRAARNGP